MSGRPIRIAAVGALALVVALQVVALRAHSLSGDEANHLLAGHQALRYGTHSLNIEHPPLVKVLVSLPLMLEEEPLAEPLRFTEADANFVYEKPEMMRRATARGRSVALALFVLPFFAACFWLGRRVGRDGGPGSGTAVGVVLVSLLGLSLSVLPYLTLLLTDTAVCLAFVLTILAAWRFVERPGLGNAALVGLSCGFALAVKFSSVLLGPTVLVAFAIAPGLRRRWSRRLGELFLAGVVAVVVLHLACRIGNPDYDPETGRDAIATSCRGEGALVVEDLMRPWESRLLAFEEVDPYLAQWLTGLLGVRAQNQLGIYPSYALGEVQSRGRWWYFPVVLAIKTPLAVLFTAAAAAVTLLRTGRRLRAAPGTGPAWILIGVTVAVYLAAAMTSNYNQSIRHLLPILPFLYLPLALWLARRRRIAVGVVAVLALESFVLSPMWMSSTNTWWLGARNPTRFALSAGNLEYRQNLVQLARWAEENEIEGLRVLYPVPRHVLAAYLPDAELVRPGHRVEPGWYAVNVIMEQHVPAMIAAPPGAVRGEERLRRSAERWHPLWRSVVERGEDHGWAAGTFHVYRVP